MTAKDLGKNYINVRPPLARHLQRNRLFGAGEGINNVRPGLQLCISVVVGEIFVGKNQKNKSYPKFLHLITGIIYPSRYQ